MTCKNKHSDSKLHLEKLHMDVIKMVINDNKLIILNKNELGYKSKGK